MNRSRASRGFSFIEVLVVMGIISILASMVVVLIPRLNERAARTKSQDNLRSIAMMFIGQASSRVSAKWPPYNGKNFTLSPIAYGEIRATNREDLAIFFAPNDQLYTTENVNWDRYKDITKDNLKSDQDFHECTSYAGRRNKDRDHLLTANRIEEGALILCDDDDGPLHHTQGLVVATANGAARFMTWEELGMAEPEDPDNPARFLGEAASSDKLRGLDSSN